MIGATGATHLDGAEAASASRSDTIVADEATIALTIALIADRVGGNPRDLRWRRRVALGN